MRIESDKPLSPGTYTVAEQEGRPGVFRVVDVEQRPEAATGMYLRQHLAALAAISSEQAVEAALRCLIERGDEDDLEWQDAVEALKDLRLRRSHAT